MQRLVRLKLDSILTKKLSNSSTNTTTSSLYNSHPYKAFGSLTKPVQTHAQNHHSHHHFLSHKLHGFLSKPLLTKPFCFHSSNTHFRTLPHSRLGFLRTHFPKLGFEFDHLGFPSNWPNWRSRLRGLRPNNTVCPMVLGLIIANVGVFLLWKVADQTFMFNNFTISMLNLKLGRLHTLVTHSISHNVDKHLFDNMIGLLFFGTHLSRVYGPAFLLKLYLASAVSGSIFFLAHSSFKVSSLKGQELYKAFGASAMGSSNAVNAIILFDLLIFPKPAAYLVGICLIGQNAFGMLKGNTLDFAHLGGAVAAAVIWAQLRKSCY